MRQIGTLEHEPLATRLSAFLTSLKIANSVDATFDVKSEQPSYTIWVHDEDHLAEAAEVFKRFQANPDATEFNSPVLEPVMVANVEEPIQASHPKLTLFWILVCVVAFFLNAMQEVSLRKAGFAPDSFLMTPIRFKMLYDLPPLLSALEPMMDKKSQIPDEYFSIEGTVYWKGIYHWILEKIADQEEPMGVETLFFKIRQGQIWRLFSPSLLHSGLLHIAFNMLWLWALGKEIDPRIGVYRSLLLTVSTGVVSNTVQYLMGGPFFLGYSGIIAGLAGFIWSRQKKAPWEGYPLKRSMLLFLGIYILAMFVLQIGSFVYFFFTHQMFLFQIANSAHISGAIWGYCMGRLSFFEAKA